MGKGKVKIKIDYTKCTQPTECRKCVNLCPEGVFMLFFTDKDFRNPTHYIVDAVLAQLCNYCKKCIEICPENAISLKVKKKYEKELYISR